LVSRIQVEVAGSVEIKVEGKRVERLAGEVVVGEGFLGVECVVLGSYLASMA